MTMIPAFGPWTEHPADTDEEKRLASAQQSKPCKLHLQRFCKAQKALQAHFPAGYGAWYH